MYMILQAVVADVVYCDVMWCGVCSVVGYAKKYSESSRKEMKHKII